MSAAKSKRITVQKKEARSSYDTIIKKFNDIALNYSSILSDSAMAGAFMRAGYGMANMPQIQNQRVKGIASLPCDYTKEQIGEFLLSPYESEIPLRQTSQTLKWTSYPYFKILKLYADLPLYKYYSKPLYLSDFENKEFIREAILIDKLNKTLSPDMWAHKIVGEALTSGKVFYIPRIAVDKVHNKIKYAFLQRLPQDYCKIIGFNNISGYTISFNMMYFMQPGTDYRQFGDLFDPFLADFNNMFRKKSETDPRYVYADLDNRKDIVFAPENINPSANGNPKIFQQNGVWAYWVSLPINKVFTFEIDDTSAAAAPVFSGLMLTLSQQSDYEQIQKELLTNPLVKIFTGSIPYFTEDGAHTEDGFRLSSSARIFFEACFNSLMAANSTGGAAFFSAPVNDIKSHDYAESANANDISTSFSRYAIGKSGLSPLMPIDEDVKASQVSAAEYIESRFVNVVLTQFSRMMRVIYESLNLKFDWDFRFIGDIFHESELRENFEKAIARGDTSAYIPLAALDGESLIDKMSAMREINAFGFTDMLKAPDTSYTKSKQEQGRPPKTTKDVIDGDAGESTEDQIDAYGEK